MEVEIIGTVATGIELRWDLFSQWPDGTPRYSDDIGVLLRGVSVEKVQRLLDTCDYVFMRRVKKDR